MGDDLDKLTIMENKHRKERKDLQAQIQALKKSAKNDKTKKKELTVEIVKLEAELDTRQKQEIEAIRSADPVETSEVEVEHAKVVKMSKAQKRRDKKSQQEKEREEQIKIQEKENLHGPRNIEMQAISTRLNDRKLKIFPIASDGDCLYNAVSHQLSIKRGNTISVSELRTSVAAHIRENKNDFMPFMSHPDTCEMLTDSEFEEYCNKITNSKVWGGQLEIRALSNTLKCPISIIQATGPESIEQGTEFEGTPLVITYHRHMYSLGEHYNSTCTSNDTEDA